VFVPMTGEADRSRPPGWTEESPCIVNAGFEDIDPANGRALGWYHPRQMAVIRSTNAPAGQQYATFENHTPGRAAQATQAFALDGRRARVLSVSALAHGTDLAVGPTTRTPAWIVLTFYDSEHAMLRQSALAGSAGGFDWQRIQTRMAVPRKTREAIIGIGLFGATGRLSLDTVAVAVAP